MLETQRQQERGGGPTELDPITFEVIQNGLASTADEMALVIMRSAYSPVVRDTMDYSTALCDRDGQIIAQGLTLAVQLGTFPTIMRHIVGEHSSSMVPGDVFIANDPYGSGGQHLPDIYIIEPVFVDNVLEGYAATMAHHSDVGGIAPGSSAVHATEIYQEGLRLPLLKLYEAGRPNQTLFDVIAKNTRQPIEVLGDLRAQIAACKIGAAGLRQIVARYGRDTARAYMQELQRVSEQLMRAALTAIPDGVYSFRDYIDGYGARPSPLVLGARVDVHGDELTIVLDAPAQVSASLNCPVGLIYAACYCAIRQVIDTDLPNCEGYMRPITINAPQGTIVNPTLPASCGARGVVGYRVYDAVMGALAQAVPDRVPAPGEGGPTLIAFGGRDQGRPFVLTEVMVGCWGARPDSDGLEGVSNPLANLSNQPVELIEADFPLQVLAYGLAPDSGGPGRNRGGLGFVREYRVLADSVRMTLRSDRRDHPPHGLEGGAPGSPSTFVLNPGREFERLLPVMPMEAIELCRGDVVHHTSAGGGGMGDPYTRDAERVLADVLDGKVSAGAARVAYGVVIENGVVEVEHTAREREQRSRSTPA
jgi:N-methylhydantoinase B